MHATFPRVLPTPSAPHAQLFSPSSGIAAVRQMLKVPYKVCMSGGTGWVMKGMAGKAELLSRMARTGPYKEISAQSAKGW